MGSFARLDWFRLAASRKSQSPFGIIRDPREDGAIPLSTLGGLPIFAAIYTKMHFLCQEIPILNRLKILNSPLDGSPLGQNINHIDRKRDAPLWPALASILSDGCVPERGTSACRHEGRGGFPGLMAYLTRRDVSDIRSWNMKCAIRLIISSPGKSEHGRRNSRDPQRFG